MPVSGVQSGCVRTVLENNEREKIMVHWEVATLPGGHVAAAFAMGPSWESSVKEVLTWAPNGKTSTHILFPDPGKNRWSSLSSWFPYFFLMKKQTHKQTLKNYDQFVLNDPWKIRKPLREMSVTRWSKGLCRRSKPTPHSPPALRAASSMPHEAVLSCPSNGSGRCCRHRDHVAFGNSFVITALL